jgi:transcriptional regulator with XRE-family HTH domain
MTRGPRIACNGTRLRELREDLEISIRDLAAKASVDAKTVIDLEHGRRSWVYPKTLKSIAAALSALGRIDVDWTELQANTVEAAPKKRPARIADELPPRSSLDALVAAERKHGPPPPLSTKNGAVRAFGPAQLVEVFTAYAAHAGDRYYVRGEVTSQRGLRYCDCRVLDIPHATGARFEIARRIPGVEKPLLLTVLALDKATTRQLQTSAASGATVSVIVRVIAATPPSDDEERVFIAGLERLEKQPRPRRYRDEIFFGFEQIEEKSESKKPKPHPWALIVEEIAT